MSLAEDQCGARRGGGGEAANLGRAAGGGVRGGVAGNGDLFVSGRISFLSHNRKEARNGKVGCAG